MDGELQRYHKANAALDLTIGEQRLRSEGLQTEVLRQRAELGACHRSAARFCHDLHDVVQSIQVMLHCATSSPRTLSGDMPGRCAQRRVCGNGNGRGCSGAQDPKALKDKVKAMYGAHIAAPAEPSELDEGVQQEHRRQRDYLEKTVRGLKSKLDKDLQLHRTDTLRIMQENVALLKEINELRREIKQLRTAAAFGSVPGPRGGSSAGDGDHERGTAADLAAALDEVAQLEAAVSSRDERIAALEAQILPRPVSRERLPQMEGFTDEAAAGGK